MLLPKEMVGLKEVQAAMIAPGLVTKVPLSFNQLKAELAKKLHIEVDDAVFSEHKQAIKDNYIKVYSSVCQSSDQAPALTPAAAKKPVSLPSKAAAPPAKASALAKSAALPAKSSARAVPTKKAKKRNESESEEEESDASESGSDSDESEEGGRKINAFSSDPEIRRLTGIAK
jgi:hypothetical protein